MARTVKSIEEEDVKLEISTEDSEVSTEKTPDVEVSTEKTPDVEVSTEKKNVKIRIVEEVDCIIACKPYKFSKDKEVVVSSDVASILCFAKKAYRL